MKRRSPHTAFCFNVAFHFYPKLMKSIHIFNPDTDYALASNREYYTPPISVVKLRRENALLPSLYADSEDVILLLDDSVSNIGSLRYFEVCVKKNINILTLDNAAKQKEQFREYKFKPWGWNKNIRRILIDTFGDIKFLPDYKDIENIRELSHRRTTIPFLKHFIDSMDYEIEIPQEITNIDNAMKLYKSKKDIFFKAPWSSSGRGIIRTDDLEEKHVFPWLKGIIRRQGSVIAEKAYHKSLDFATEWECKECESNFIGLSIFNASRRGKYHYNLNKSQNELLKIIKDKTDEFTDELLMKQKEAIEKIISPEYTGPLGIDMIVTNRGQVHPCIEINLRRTMGMITNEFHLI